ncbi:MULTISPECIES: siderophore-interacting protein [unclassified Rhodococcus (in: high G+C Gram-positive bacteria)]|uniref:siderophore-interacting protein n=1 Tax=unclassified Rhodococcus (in: high G+C Gram-positive bacteria) TaxID=192944 RepID=UPI00117AC397|nr:MULTISPECIES: siderophore-interacting protein [unclassified Rhodococcus (in: high G+C Gram-positive bacteria)]
MARSHRLQVVFPEVIRTATVIDTRQLGPGMRRIVLGGPQLREFTRDGFEFPALRSEGFDDFVRLFFPLDDMGTMALPVQHERTVEWPRDPRPVTRNYTVRSVDTDSTELTLDFVTHDTGIASTWGRRCSVGDSIPLLGPVRSGHAPAEVDWVLLVGDETALPAVARYLDEAAAGERIRVFVEVADAERELPLPTAADAEITWVHRDGAVAGTGDLLETAVRSALWWDGTVFAWVAGESTALKGIRRYLREDRALPPEMVEVTGYWRRAEVLTRTDDPEVPDLTARESEPFDRLAERAELFSPFAIRAANTLRIPLHVSRGVRTVGELATVTGTDVRALAKFVRYLRAVDVLGEDSDGGVVLADIGEAMLGDDWISHWLDLEGIEARVELSITGLVESLRTGGASVSLLTGRTLSEDLAGSSRLTELHHNHIADEAAFLGPALVQDYSFDDVSTLAVTGAASGVVLGSILTAHDAMSATVLGLPSELDLVRRDLQTRPELPARVTECAQSVVSEPRTTPAGGFDAYLLLEVTGHYRDDDLALLLASAASGVSESGKLIVVERLSDEQSINEDQAEFDLLMLCMHGSGVRTRAEFESVAAAAGLTVTASRLVGWGIAVLDLRRASEAVVRKV